MEPEKGIESLNHIPYHERHMEWNPRKGLKVLRVIDFLRSKLQWNPRKGLKVGGFTGMGILFWCGTRERD